jgi:Tol biopolymer transport system component
MKLRPRSRLGAASGAAAVIVLVLAVNGGTVSAASAQAGLIAFVSDRDGDPGVYVTDRDGQNLRKFVGNAFEPRWAPDGAHLAFIRVNQHQADSSLFVTDLARTSTRSIGSISPIGGSTSSYAWSPDSKRIVYSNDRGLFVVDRDGRHRRMLAADGFAPTWSPDGKAVAFLGVDALWRIGVDGSARKRLAERKNDNGSSGPDWSPSGSEIAFAQAANDIDVFLVSVSSEGGAVRRLLRKPGFGIAFRWSPDGGRIAVIGIGSVGAIVVGRDGGHPLVVTRGGQANEPHLSWSPDSRFIAVENKRDDLIVASADGSGSRRIVAASNYGYEASSPDWYPKAHLPQTLTAVPVSQLPASDSRQIGLTLKTRNRVEFLAADGPRVAIAYTTGPPCLELWTPTTRKIVRFTDDICYSTEQGGEPVYMTGLALAGQRLAWSSRLETNHSIEAISSASPSHPGTTDPFVGEQDVDRIPRLAGDGKLIVFETVSSPNRFLSPPEPVRGPTLWRLRADDAVSFAHLSGPLLGVGNDKVVVKRGARAVDVLDTKGRRLATFTIPASVRAAAIDGDTTAIASKTFIYAYSLAKRSRLVTRPTARGKLLDLAAGIALLADGHHFRLVRLRDGALAIINPPSGRATSAQLESSGLFYDAIGRAKRGSLVAFIPLGQLTKRFR